MNQINPKDRSMIARMAGNIVGPLLATLMENEFKTHKKINKDILAIAGQMAVSQAIEILDAISMRLPCGKCEECKAGIRCREIPTGEENANQAD